MKHRYKPHFRREDISDAEGLLAALRQLFPKLSRFPDQGLVDDLMTGDANHHTVLRDFRLALIEDEADESQIAGLASLIDISLSKRDDVENAWMTCFLEHHVRHGPLWAQLSPETKKYIRAN